MPLEATLVSELPARTLTNAHQLRNPGQSLASHPAVRPWYCFATSTLTFVGVTGAAR